MLDGNPPVEINGEDVGKRAKVAVPLLDDNGLPGFALASA
jgi:hypothetical protein